MGLPLNYDEFGDGPRMPLVILHGVFGSSSNWRTLARKLADDRRVLVVDLRNHGESPHADEMHYRDMVEDLNHFIDEHCGGTADVLGHSMGGKAAMSLALLHPNHVRRLVVVDIAPVDYGHGETFRRLISAMRDLPLDELESRKQADELLSEAIAEQGVRAFLLQNLRRDDEGHWQWRINLEVIAASIDDIAGFPFEDRCCFPGPTLFVGGGDSDYLDEAHREVIDALFTEARVEWIEGAGHWVHAEKPQELLGLVSEFLKPAPRN